MLFEFLYSRKKENKNPREDGTPPPHRDFRFCRTVCTREAEFVPREDFLLGLLSRRGERIVASRYMSNTLCFCGLLLSSVSDHNAVASLHARLQQDRFAIVPASELWPLLLEHGATETGRSPFAGYWDLATPQRDEHGIEIYPYKGTLTSYYAMDTSRSDDAQRSTAETEPEFPGHVVEHIDPTTVNGDNASYYRLHQQWPLSADSNTVMLAVQRLVHRLMAAGATGSFHAMFSAFRVTRSETALGDPSPEGVHQDSAVLTIVMLMRRHNAAHFSGGSRVWSLEQPSGKPTTESVRSDRLLASHTLREPFDALFLLDREVKHEALPVLQADEAAGPATRDVLTIEVRRPPRSEEVRGGTCEG